MSHQHTDGERIQSAGEGIMAPCMAEVSQADFWSVFTGELVREFPTSFHQKLRFRFGNRLPVGTFRRLQSCGERLDLVLGNGQSLLFDNALAETNLQADKRTIDRLGRPGFPSRVCENMSSVHPSVYDALSGGIEIDDSRRSLHLFLVDGKDDSRVWPVDMSWLDRQTFCCSRSRLPNEHHEITEIVVANIQQDFRVLVRRDHFISLPASWLFEVSQGRPFDQSLFLAPVHAACDRPCVVSLRTGRETKGVDPLLDVEWFQAVSSEIRVSRRKKLQTGLIPEVRVGCSVCLHPFEKAVNQYDQQVGLFNRFGGLPHQFMELLERLFSVGAEIVTFALNRHEPSFTFFSIPRFRNSGHVGRPFSV